MALRESPFSNCFLRDLHCLAWALIFPCYWSLDRLLATCVETTWEKEQRREQECYLLPIRVVFGTVLFLVLFVLSLPFALVGFVLWVPLQAARRPFSYSHCRDVNAEAAKEWGSPQEEQWRVFSFVTANLCLLPDSLARLNNLSHTQTRSLQIGKYIVQGVTRPKIKIYIDSPSSGGMSHGSKRGILTPPHLAYGTVGSSCLNEPAAERDASLKYIDSSEEGSESDRRWECKGGKGDANTDPSAIMIAMSNWQPRNDGDGALAMGQPRGGRRTSWRASIGSQKEGDIPCEISSFFPTDVDLICLQEVFDKRAAAKLKSILNPVFGHVLYDVGVYALQGRCGFKFFNSGLFLASRYPILEAEYHCYSNARGEDALAAKGLLCAKIQVGTSPEGQGIVGYYNCTHLHAPEEDGQIRCDQLTSMMDWINKFQKATRLKDEIVVFDVLCGDFNFDNCSPGESFSLQKERIVI
nr:PREDICTED: sphingomyelin phosphodiesterase 3 [Latimeria chalumnae]|eukprot:XP_014352074.1 PREDICTED: sphingomyelin phosphodiesterase 3 [Latimeria chalumnae]